MGLVRRGSFKNKGSGKGGCLWGSSRASLYLAYTYDESAPLRSLASMQLRSAPRDVPSLEGMYHGSYDVNLYHVRRLPGANLRLLAEDVSSRSKEAFDAALGMLRERLREREIYVIRKVEGGSTMYCEVKAPTPRGRHAYRSIISTKTDQGVWRIFCMDFSEQHADCSASALKWWKSAKDLKGHGSVVTALRYAMKSLGTKIKLGEASSSSVVEGSDAGWV